jgi:hypothetical protein
MVKPLSFYDMQEGERVAKKAKTMATQSSALDKSRKEVIDHTLGVSYVIWNVVLPTLECEPEFELAEALFPLRALVTRKCLERQNRQDWLKLVCERGLLRTAMWLVKEYNFTKDDPCTWNELTFGAACAKGYLEIAEWLTTKFALTITDVAAVNNYALTYACQNGHMPVVVWIMTKFSLSPDQVRDDLHRVFEMVCVNGHLEIAKWITEYAPHKEIIAGVLRNVSAANHPDVSKWLMTTFRRELLDYFLRDDKMFPNTLGHFAACDDWESVKLLRDIFWQSEFMEVTVVICCRAGNIAAVDWLYATYSLPHYYITETLINDCCKLGHLQVVQLMLTKFKSGTIANQQFLMTACDNGRVDIVKWLLTITDSDTNFIIRTFLSACAYGQLEVAKYIYSQYTITAADVRKSADDGYTKSILDNSTGLRKACRNGHFETIKWMFDTFKLGLEDIREMGLLDKAFINGHYDLACWLLDNYISKVDYPEFDAVFVHVCSYGSVRMAQLYLDRFKYVLSHGTATWMMRSLLSKRHRTKEDIAKEIQMLKWITTTHNLYDCEIEPIGYYETPAKNREFEILEWFITTFKGTSELGRFCCFKEACLAPCMWFARFAADKFDPVSHRDEILDIAVRCVQFGYYEPLQFLARTFGVTFEELKTAKNWHTVCELKSMANVKKCFV